MHFSLIFYFPQLLEVRGAERGREEDLHTSV